MARPRDIWPIDLHTVGLATVADKDGEYTPHLGFQVAEGSQAGRQLSLDLTPQGARDLAKGLERFADRAEELNSQTRPFSPTRATRRDP